MEIKKDIKIGFIRPKIDATHYIFGAQKLPAIVLQSDGNWQSLLPLEEAQQQFGIETYGCTVFGTSNQLEILMNRIFGFKPNYSDRALYIASNITPPGGDPHQVSEQIRNGGVIDEKLLPFLNVTSLKDYNSPNPLPQDLIQQGLNWVAQYLWGHEWVWTDDTLSLTTKQKLLKECLKYSPIGVSVFAWQEENGIYFKNPGQQDEHWTTLIGMENRNGYWIIFDSYPETNEDTIQKNMKFFNLPREKVLYLKRLRADFNFDFAKRYHIEQKILNQPVKKNNWYLKVLQSLKSFYKYLIIGGIVLTSLAGIYGSRQQYRNYPNHSLTPGLIRTNDIQDICGHTTGTYRKTTQAMKNEVYREYGIKNHPQGSYEIDHYYPLAIGGADDIKNLWAQPAPEFHAKDKVENQLRIKLCKGEITQQQAIDTINHWDKQNLGGIGQINDPDDE